ncbi:hypothetical protein SAMN06297387_108221 [Streptomyces zhaozhouensis]|uniref:Homeodomain-like domain-containing protein n=1 Tax=Streptomyces zhaozhouensis TaxID=1300267 RepID=A0A286DWM7_9ACTN|nr:hypothetical protein [Streptomyces zhaozhouensis]SOD63058.1 hypothetical protein SAMN06297387_108221 [Streptomyces zhaozhouensis]
MPTARAEAFTREPPKSLRDRISYLIRELGSVRAVAAEIGVTAGSVNRYRRGAHRNPPPAVTARVEVAVRAVGSPGCARPPLLARRSSPTASTTTAGCAA